MAADRPKKWAIEDSFPIVEINRLAVPERNSFKPIYQMHKWFARRASCVFRAILLGCLKPLPLDKNGNPTKSGAQVIMEEFYRDHTRDTDTNGKAILDPFMGGGTTVVEAQRLGCKVVGIDLNPVAWFIVKTETTPVDVEALQRAFDDLANRTVPWSGKPLKQTLLDLYKTTCPCCGNTDADIIYTFWVKSAICTDPTCHRQVPLFSDYVVATKEPSIRYVQDVTCPKCRKTFDWELEPASLIAESSLTLVNNGDGAGIGRGNKRWVFSTEEPVDCPWCGESVRPHLAPGKTKPVRKKVPLNALLCPNCQAVWQYRGSVLDHVACPACRHEYSTSAGNAPESGKFVCPHCGKKDAVLSSIRSLPEDQPLPTSMYAVQGYCSACGNGGEDDESEDNDTFLDSRGTASVGRRAVPPPTAVRNHRCLLTKQNGKFIKRLEPADLDRFAAAKRAWEAHKARLPYPTSEVPEGQETQRLLEHHYRFWHQMFNERQLLSLSSLLQGIAATSDPALRNALLGAFQMSLEANNMFARYRVNAGGRSPFGGIFSRHDFQVKLTTCEINVWGPYSYYGVYEACLGKTLEGIRFARRPFDWRSKQKVFQDVLRGESELQADDARTVALPEAPVEAIVTDPPYAGNVNYSELADFFYVWLRLPLAREVPAFAPEASPKVTEIVENAARGVTLEQFKEGLADVFRRCGSLMHGDGVLAFTFHHRGGATWEILLRAILDAGFLLEAVYPIHGESESSMHLMATQSISYDLIHVCRKRQNAAVEARSWAGIRQEVRRRARQEIETIERGRYGNEPLSPADVNIVLIGKCLELYSRHYGHVLDHEGKNVPLHDALEAIRMEVDQLVTTEQPLPSELADIDPVSYVYLVCLADKAFEIKGDELHKYTRGVIEPDELIGAGLIIKGRTGRGRYFKIKSPAERFTELQEKFSGQGGSGQATLPGMEDIATGGAHDKTPFIDHVHFLIALVEGRENLRPWTERFRGLTPQIRAACEYLRDRQPRFASACDKILKFIEVAPLFRGRE